MYICVCTIRLSTRIHSTHFITLDTYVCLCQNEFHIIIIFAFQHLLPSSQLRSFDIQIVLFIYFPALK